MVSFGEGQRPADGDEQKSGDGESADGDEQRGQDDEESMPEQDDEKKLGRGKRVSIEITPPRS